MKPLKWRHRCESYENGLLAGYVYVDITGRDVGGYVDDPKRAVAAAVKLPSGYALEWSGQYENMQRVTQRLKLVVPFTLFLILFLLYANTKSLIVVLAVWSIGTGADVMKRVAAPMVGGLATSFALERSSTSTARRPSSTARA